jgi:hypothetical protein
MASLPARVVLALAFSSLGVTLVVAPPNWLERWFAIDPDFGSGRIESLLAWASIGLGACFIVGATRAHRRGARVRLARGDSATRVHRHEDATAFDSYGEAR